MTNNDIKTGVTILARPLEEDLPRRAGVTLWFTDRWYACPDCGDAIAEYTDGRERHAYCRKHGQWRAIERERHAP